MHRHDLSPWTHSHVFDRGNRAAERGTRAIVWITGVAMVVEILAGWWFNSMALLADGWHMSSHTLAIGLSVFAYTAARRLADDPRFAFGTWKIEVLGGFASAIVLLGVAAMMVFGALERFVSPQSIHYREAIVVAVLGLGINLLSALILGHAHEHDHDHGGHAHHHHHHDLNLKSAYVHVLTDALTSILAIVALAGGWLYGWDWLDPLMGLLGAVLVAVWARSLLMETGKVLLDREMDHPVVQEVREVIEAEGTEVTDLHVWRVGRYSYACALGILTHDPALDAAEVRERLAEHPEIVHATIEIHLCGECGTVPARDRAGSRFTGA